MKLIKNGLLGLVLSLLAASPLVAYYTKGEWWYKDNIAILLLHERHHADFNAYMQSDARSRSFSYDRSSHDQFTGQQVQGIVDGLKKYNGTVLVEDHCQAPVGDALRATEEAKYNYFLPKTMSSCHRAVTFPG